MFGTESDGRVLAWRRESGEPAWTSERLKHRTLGAPLALGSWTMVTGEDVTVGKERFVVTREDGTEMTRLSTDGSPIVASPLLAGDALVVQTRNGGLFAWRPQ